MKKRILLLIFIIFLYQEGFPQTAANPMRIYYRSGQRTLDLSYRDNHLTLQRIVHLLDQAHRANEIDSVVVCSYASLDGSNLMNKRLTQLRADSLAAYLLRNTDIPEEMMKIRAGGIGWHILHERVEASDMPYRREVLRIIEQTPEWIRDRHNVIVDRRKKQLMDLEGGKVYYYMKEHFFPDMRSCSAVSLYLKKDTPTTAASAEVPESSVVPLPNDKQETSKQSQTSPVNEQATADEEAGEPLHRLAVKTNLLYDAVLMPSVEVEYRINDRWSVNLEGDIAWWKKKSKHKYYQLAIISPEARYWFKTKKPWHGHYVGAFVGGGWYDLENGKRGYQGEGFMAGVSYGYMFPVTRCLSFEAGIGAGYLRAKYDEYLPEAGGHYLYQQTSKTNYFGPLKLKFALVWRLWDLNKKKGGMQ